MKEASRSAVSKSKPCACLRLAAARSARRDSDSKERELHWKATYDTRLLFTRAVLLRPPLGGSPAQS
jgi:hypothetical protein